MDGPRAAPGDENVGATPLKARGLKPGGLGARSAKKALGARTPGTSLASAPVRMGARAPRPSVMRLLTRCCAGLTPRAKNVMPLGAKSAKKGKVAGTGERRALANISNSAGPGTPAPRATGGKGKVEKLRRTARKSTKAVLAATPTAKPAAEEDEDDFEFFFPGPSEPDVPLGLHAARTCDLDVDAFVAGAEAELMQEVLHPAERGHKTALLSFTPKREPMAVHDDFAEELGLFDGAVPELEDSLAALLGEDEFPDVQLRVDDEAT